MELSSDQISDQLLFRKFVEEQISDYANTYDQAGAVPREVIEKMAKAGYLGATIDKAYGGLGIDAVGLGLLNEEFGRGCSSIRSLLTVHGMVSIAVQNWGDLHQREAWLPRLANGEMIGAFALSEQQAGSDANSIETTAVKVDGGYLLTGIKKWITFGQIADIFLVFAIYDGQPTAFLIERLTPGLGVKPIVPMLGTRASLMSEIEMVNCFVPDDNRIGAVGAGIAYIASNCLDYGRYSIAWGCVGIGSSCLQDSLRYIQERKQFGKFLHENQLIKKMVSEMVVQIEASRLMCLQAGGMKDQKLPQSIIATWQAKYFASKMCRLVTDYAVQIHGANGCSSEHRIERFFRDAKIMEIIEGSTQIHEIMIADQAILMHAIH